jgi:hypothetical protein
MVWEGYLLAVALLLYARNAQLSEGIQRSGASLMGLHDRDVPIARQELSLTGDTDRASVLAHIKERRCASRISGYGQPFSRRLQRPSECPGQAGPCCAAPCIADHV